MLKHLFIPIYKFAALKLEDTLRKTLESLQSSQLLNTD
jgi:hypothetical protein